MDSFLLSSVYASPIEYNSAIYVDDIFFPVDKKRTLTFTLNDVSLQMILYALNNVWLVDSIEHAEDTITLCPHCGHLTESATYCIGFSRKEQEVLFHRIVKSNLFRLQGLFDFPELFS